MYKRPEVVEGGTWEGYKQRDDEGIITERQIANGPKMGGKRVPML